MVLHYFRLGCTCASPLQSNYRKHAVISEILGVLGQVLFIFPGFLKQDDCSFLLQKLLVLLLQQHESTEVPQVPLFRVLGQATCKRCLGLSVA